MSAQLPPGEIEEETVVTRISGSMDYTMKEVFDRLVARMDSLEQALVKNQHQMQEQLAAKIDRMHSGHSVHGPLASGSFDHPTKRSFDSQGSHHDHHYSPTPKTSSATHNIMQHLGLGNHIPHFHGFGGFHHDDHHGEHKTCNNSWKMHSVAPTSPSHPNCVNHDESSGMFGAEHSIPLSDENGEKKDRHSHPSHSGSRMTANTGSPDTDEHDHHHGHHDRDSHRHPSGSMKSRKQLRSHWSNKSKKSLEKWRRDHRTTIIQQVVWHPAFEYVSACVILFHSCLIGAYIEWMASNGPPVHPVLKYGNQILAGVFVMEVVLKLGAEKEEYFKGKEYTWNFFDLFLISILVVEVFLAMITTGKNKNVKWLLKFGEMIRTARVIRIFRVLRFSSTLQVICAKILNSLTALLWILVLVAILMFVVASILTSGVTEYLRNQIDDQIEQQDIDLQYFFGNLPRSFYTIFKAISGGVVWGEIADPLSSRVPIFFVVLVCFIGMCFFAVLNVITGICVDSAIQSAQHDRDLILSREQKLNEVHENHLRDVFNELDEEGTGFITKGAFLECMEDPTVKYALQALKIDFQQADKLFHIIDEDDSGTVHLSKFVEGFMRLKGEARSVDVRTLMFENERVLNCLLRFIQFTESEFEFMKDTQRHIHAVARGTHQAVAQRNSVVAEST
eukprot:gnl/TRDRNA2_/TRDRNA2_92864_c0_seq1.p1 gnl/TRDRNA2_/TRDRNA2_92864_c0~~gnl/TRDRNA2_/TRDRNA2_92864_c0_seq1.p1  ORF type:complete len:711 (+),score=97.32 gnl/TRDRNA2_/TRDRNA2_92864_c0_seq1:109-2133(+)